MLTGINDLLIKENTILAGTRVTDKSGGPNMVIVSFSSEMNDIVNQKFIPKKPLRQKVFVNKERKTITELTNGLIRYNKRCTYFFFSDIFTEIIINSYSSCSDVLYIICKYWSDKDGEFVYVNKTLPELETI